MDETEIVLTAGDHFAMVLTAILDDEHGINEEAMEAVVEFSQTWFPASEKIGAVMARVHATDGRFYLPE